MSKRMQDAASFSRCAPDASHQYASHSIAESLACTKAVLQDYPHGAPKLLLKKLREHGHTETPSLGFGSESSLTPRTTHLLRY